jgi:UDP-glucuronate decarboxylase
VQDMVEEIQKESGVENPTRVNIVHKDMPVDDPQRRRADTSRAKEVLQWQPQWNVRQGVKEMILYYRDQLKEGKI